MGAGPKRAVKRPDEQWASSTWFRVTREASTEEAHPSSQSEAGLASRGPRSSIEPSAGLPYAAVMVRCIMAVAVTTVMLAGVGSAQAAAPATVSGTLGGATLPKSGDGVAFVRAMSLTDLSIVAATRVARNGRYALKLPKGDYALTSTLVRRGAALLQTSVPVRLRAGQRVKQPLSLKRRRRRRRRSASGREAAASTSTATTTPEPRSHSTSSAVRSAAIGTCSTKASPTSSRSTWRRLPRPAR